MLKNLTNGINRNQKGITGLETAIILIAFVVVAAVFAYTVLSAGLFASQKSGEAVYSSLQKTRSTLKLVGDVILRDTDDNDSVDEITFTLASALGGEPVNFATAPNNVVVISYSDKDQRVTDLTWSVTRLGDADSDNLLESGERFAVTVSSLETSLEPDLGINTEFTIELHDGGASLFIERATGATVDAVMRMR